MASVSWASCKQSALTTTHPFQICPQNGILQGFNKNHDSRWLFAFVVKEPKGSFSARRSTVSYVSNLGPRWS